MLKEQKNVRQIKNENHRRLFQDENFDLFVWTNSKNEFSGFQLCYQKSHLEKALSWFQDTGFSHTNVDQGEDSSNINRSPLLTADGTFPFSIIFTLFVKNSRSIDQDAAIFVKQKMEEYVHVSH